MCQGRPPEDNYDYTYAPNGNHTVTVRWSHGHDSRANVSVTATYYSPEQVKTLYEQEKYDAYHTNTSSNILIGSVASYAIGGYLGSVIKAKHVGLILFGIELFAEICYETIRTDRANTLGEIAELNCGMVVLKCNAYMSNTTVWIPWDGSSEMYGINWGTYPYAYNKGGTR